MLLHSHKKSPASCRDKCVLDDLEALLHHGKRMDITYFTDEVIGKEDIEEVRDSMDGTYDMDSLRQEWGAVPAAMPTNWNIVNLPHSWNAIDGQDAVGLRLADLALKYDYGKDIPADFPRFRSGKRENSILCLVFEHVKAWKTLHGKEIRNCKNNNFRIHCF